MRVAIAGASGFVGKALVQALTEDPRVERILALSRAAAPPPPTGSRVEWRTADLAQFGSTLEGLRGATHAIYLVHSMSPQARLAQGRFEDFDLFQADNFARACKAAGVGEIFYLGGLLPAENTSPTDWSAHLRSRFEVERALAAYGARVTVFRAGLILGPNGSSADILLKLVRRLPVMASPSWTDTLSEPVDLRDVVAGIRDVLFRPEIQGQVWDLTCDEQLTYRELMARTASALGQRRLIILIPILTPRLSQLWVSTVTGAPRALVDPLIESLSHPMLSRTSHQLHRALGRTPIRLSESLKFAISSRASQGSSHKLPLRASAPTRDLVFSIQRFEARRFEGESSIAADYFRWLEWFFRGWIWISVGRASEGPRRNAIRTCGIELLSFGPPETPAEGIEQLTLAGGALKAQGSQGTLEFRRVPAAGAVLAIVQNFEPRLPWFIYRLTQAPLHLWVMRRFGRIASSGN